MTRVQTLANPGVLLLALSAGSAAYLLQLPLLDVLAVPIAVLAVAALAATLVRATPPPVQAPAAVVGATPDPRPPTRARALLSPRELLVSEQVSKGLTNQQIADLLHVEPSTIKSQLTTVKNKLGFNHRAQVAAWWVQTGMESLDSTPKSPPV